MNYSAKEKNAVVIIIGTLEILGGIFLITLSLDVAASETKIIWGNIAGIVMVVSGAGLMRMLEWARQLSVFVCCLLFLSGWVYLFLMMNTFAQGDRLYGGGPSDTMVYMVSIIIMAAGIAGARLLGKYKDKFR